MGKDIAKTIIETMQQEGVDDITYKTKYLITKQQIENIKIGDIVYFINKYNNIKTCIVIQPILKNEYQTEGYYNGKFVISNDDIPFMEEEICSMWYGNIYKTKLQAVSCLIEKYELVKNELLKQKE